MAAPPASSVLTPMEATIGTLRLTASAGGIALLNTASPWASDYEQLEELYAHPHTSAVTVRTALVERGNELSVGFREDKTVHTARFIGEGASAWSINSYGYSPRSLLDYLDIVTPLLARQEPKPLILSLTGNPDSVETAIARIQAWAADKVDNAASRVGIEINLSCPNIKGSAKPTGYDADTIELYGEAIQRIRAVAAPLPQLTVGLKLPPYTYEAEFTALVAMLERLDASSQGAGCGIGFLTTTNTLGNALWLDDALQPALPVREDGYQGFGGLAGAALHPLSLGNVRRFRTLLDASSCPSVRAIQLIGAGGVDSAKAARRMVAAGATAVGLATALGHHGVGIFSSIAQGGQP